MLTPDYPIQTERLTLRAFREDDFAGLYAIQSRPDVARYLYWSARDEAGVRESLALKMRGATLTDEGHWLNVAVVLSETGRLVGEVNLRWLSREHRQGELGFILHPDHHRRGYATEAARAVLGLAFADLGLHRVIGRLDARNNASARTLERLGMRREAHFVQNEYVKGEWADEVVYAVLAAEWRRAGR